MSNKLASLRRDLDHIRKHRTEIIAQKSRLATRLSDLNKDLRSKKIPYEHYESKFKYLLGGKSVEGKKKYFKKRLIAIKHREKDLLSRIKHETHAIRNKFRLITLTAIMFAMFAPLIGVGLIDLTGFGTSTSSTTASAVVEEYYAASVSDDIVWSGTLALASNNNNATGNYNLSSNTQTGHNVHLSKDGNSDIDICISGTGNFVASSGTIGIGNLTWSANETNSISLPALSADQALTTSKVVAQQNLAQHSTTGNYTYFRYWLDIPSDAGKGTYADSTGSANITFTVTASDGDCTA